VEFVTAGGRRYQLPQISKRTAQTVVILRSGESFFIGGLIQESTRDQKRFIPGLASIPLLGAAFRSTNRKTVTTETVFKLTPTILEPGEGSSFYQRLLGEQPRPHAPQVSVSPILPATPDASILTYPPSGREQSQ
jgi:pilus assembly protein CpaC